MYHKNLHYIIWHFFTPLKDLQNTGSHMIRTCILITSIWYFDTWTYDLIISVINIYTYIPAIKTSRMEQNTNIIPTFTLYRIKHNYMLIFFITCNTKHLCLYESRKKRNIIDIITCKIHVVPDLDTCVLCWRVHHSDY